MRTIILNDKIPPMEPCVATIGFFDGVHRGHRHLIRQVTGEARKTGMQASVITFDRHPRQTVDTGYMPKLLSTTDDKLRLLSETDIDNAIVLPFDKEMASMTALDFMRDVLKRRLNVSKLIIGYDNRFGCNRADGFEQYVDYGRMLDMEVIHANELTIDGHSVSSSAIRRLLEAGDVETAALYLGYPYAIRGVVVDGKQNGRSLGFPTANINPDSVGHMIPACGVYSATVCIDNDTTLHAAMVNIGSRPTFEGEGVTIETHIFDFNEDIYGQHISVAFTHRLRDERKFDSPQQLAEQLAKDKQQALEQFKKRL